jgi:hypothetical protein
MPALAKAFWIASKVLVRESTIPFFSLATAFSDTIALSANCCWDQSSKALAHPRRAGNIRSNPQAAKRWRESASLDGMALVRPSAASQVTPLPISESEPTVAPKSPVDVAAITPHDASDVLTDTPIENGLPAYEAEAEASPMRVSIIAKRPLASLAEPSSLPLTCSPAAGDRNVSLRVAAISEPTRVISARSRVATRSFDPGSCRPGAERHIPC